MLHSEGKIGAFKLRQKYALRMIVLYNCDKLYNDLVNSTLVN